MLSPFVDEQTKVEVKYYEKQKCHIETCYLAIVSTTIWKISVSDNNFVRLNMKMKSKKSYFCFFKYAIDHVVICA